MDLVRVKYGHIAAFLAVLTAVAGIASCEQGLELGPCPQPDATHYDKDGTPDPCHCDDDAGSVGMVDPGYCQMFLASKDGGDASAEGP
jgi:hypothetical protein